MSSTFDHVLWYLIAGTRGGPNRARIVEALRRRPCNAHRLSRDLGIDYRTIRHHLTLLVKHGLLIRPAGDSYASPYFLSPMLETNFAAFEKLCALTRSLRVQALTDAADRLAQRD